MAAKQLSLFLSLFAILFIGCQSKEVDINLLPKDIQHVLQQAGRNRKTLLAVISHYQKSPADSLKLKAAYYLIRNLPRWYYYESPLLDKLQDYYGTIKEEGYSRKFTKEYVDSAVGRFYYEKQPIKFDLQELRRRDLIDNIDMTFQVWERQPWSKDYTFDQFCQYVLPYRIGDEIPENDRQAYYRKFRSVLQKKEVLPGGAVNACTAVNSELMKDDWYLFIGAGYLPHLPASKLLEYRSGDCREESDFGLYVMRSLGIPVTIDFIPHWPTRSLGHSFNAVIDKLGRPIMFEAAVNNPGYSRFSGCKMGKVFRNTFEYNDSSLSAIAEGVESIPELFENPYYIDVTDQYVSCVDVKLSIPHGFLQLNPHKFAYLCVFDDKGWTPIYWGKIVKDSILYRHMEPGILYLAGIYDGGKILPFGDPFILQPDGTTTSVTTGAISAMDSIAVKKVFPALQHRLIQLDGIFQGSNDQEFDTSTDLFDLRTKKDRQSFWNKIDVDRKESFRYVRYYRPYYCSIGDMSFYSRGHKLDGKLIASEQSEKLAHYFPKSMAVDGDPATSFIAKDKNAYEQWVGIDFGASRPIDSIIFSPGIDVNGPSCFVVAGDVYELRAWFDGRWRALDTAVAANQEVRFRPTVKKGLYWVHDISRRTEERLFTYRNGTQQFW